MIIADEGYQKMSGSLGAVMGEAVSIVHEVAIRIREESKDRDEMLKRFSNDCIDAVYLSTDELFDKATKELNDLLKGLFTKGEDDD